MGTLGISKHFFPSFQLFNVDLTDDDSGTMGRFNVPMYMLWPNEHQFTSGKLVPKPAAEIERANDEINCYYEENKL